VSDLLSAALDALKGLPPEFVVFIISALPIFEIRGGVVAGLLLEMPVHRILLFGFLGNIASVTPILLFLEPLSKWLRRNRIADRLLHWLFARAEKKAEQINRWGPLGLVLFTAIPLPVSGAWTATFASILLGVRRWRALLSIYLGVIIAGIVVSLATLGVFASWRSLVGQ
jgi:uncharacterized membrane protein